MTESWPLRPMSEIAPLVRRPVSVDPNGSYREIGIRSFGRGVFHKPPTAGLNIGEKRLFSIQPGDLLFNVVFAWEGAVAVASDAERGTVGSHRFLTCVVNPDLADARFLYWWFSRNEGRQELLRASPGGAGRNRTLGTDKLAAIQVPLPPVSEQRDIVTRIDALAAKVFEAAGERAKAIESAKALLPSLLHEYFVVRAASWSRERMDKVATITSKQVDPVLPQFSDLAHINGENIQSGTCRLLAYRTAAQDGVRSNKYSFSSGTVLYSKIRPYLRKAAFVDFAGLCSADMYPLQVIYPDIDPHFLQWALVADPFTAHANRFSGRTRMPKLNREQLFTYVISYPPQSEQRTMVSQLERLRAMTERLARDQNESRKHVEAILPAVLNRVFA
jgi:restriction endonuclease S subunit